MLTLLLYQRCGSPQAQQIAVNAEPRDDPFRERGYMRHVPELFPGVDVRHVTLDDGHLQDAKRIADGDAVVGPGTGVDHHGIDLFQMRFVDLLAELASKFVWKVSSSTPNSLASAWSR